jgi:3-(3-hydroxy-phenyl)propionate hydroxylase
MTYPERYLILTTSVDLLEVVPGLACVSYISGPADWCTLVLTNRAWRALFPVSSGESAAETLEERHIQASLSRLGQYDGQYPIEKASLYNVHRRLADTFHAGRLAIPRPPRGLLTCAESRARRIAAFMMRTF